MTVIFWVIASTMTILVLGLLPTHLDVTEQRRSEAKITHMAQHDALTDLPNRVLLRDRMEHAIAVTRNGGLDLAVLMLDLDRFKEVNDTLGHPAGDSLLRAVAARLRECTTETALIARLGGDEFAVIDYVTNPAVEAATLAETPNTGTTAFVPLSSLKRSETT